MRNNIGVKLISENVVYFIFSNLSFPGVSENGHYKLTDSVHITAN